MTKKRGGLNRGLGAFISDKQKVEEILKPSNQISVIEIPLEEIEVNIKQPRMDFDEEALKELSKSIEEHGVLQPILLNKKEDGYIIIAGERRFRASQLAGKTTIPAIIRDLDEIDREKISIIENIQRVDLNPFEEAMAYRSIMDNYKITQEELAQTIGKSRPYISNTVRLLNLDDRVLELLRKGKISSSIGRELLTISDKNQQYKKALEVIDKGISVKGLTKQRKKPKSKSQDKDIYIQEVERSFMDRLGTKVTIDDNKKSISIDYYDYEDLNRIIEIIVGELCN